MGRDARKETTECGFVVFREGNALVELSRGDLNAKDFGDMKDVAAGPDRYAPGLIRFGASHDGDANEVDSRMTYRRMEGTAAYSRTFAMRAVRLVLGLIIGKTPPPPPGTSCSARSNFEQVMRASG